MLDLSTVVAAITANAPSFASIVYPEHVDSQGIDSAEKLLTLIEPAVSSRAYPIMLPTDVTYPAAVYDLDGTDRVVIDGYPIIRQDSYSVLSFAETYDAADSAASTMRDAVLAYDPASAAGSGDILSQSSEYSDAFDLFGAAMQIELTHIARTSQALPIAFVYPVSEAWEEGEAITCVDGIAASNFVVLMVAKIPAGGVSALGSLRDEILDAVIGLTPGSDWSPIEPIGGSYPQVFSSLVIWRDEFSSEQIRTYST